jgi:high affinity Mn2+ porin
LGAGVTVAVSLVAGPLAAADLALKAPAPPQFYDWSGFYVGGHIGYAGGDSHWTSRPTQGNLPATSGTLDLFVPMDHFAENGSFLEGLQVGANRMFPNRVVLGVETDATFPAWPNLDNLAIGGARGFTSSVIGAANLSETMLMSGTVRGRIGYAPGNWLLYATGGFAWTYNQQTLTELSSGNGEATGLWRLGWAAGAGVEIPIAPNWTARGEYLYSGYPTATVRDASLGQRISSDVSLQQLRLGLNYHFGEHLSPKAAAATGGYPLADIVAFHGQATFTYQGYGSFRSPYEGANSMAGIGQSRQTFDTTLFAGLKLWQGAEFWANPEIDQGFGVANIHGTAGYLSGESYKVGKAYPYARIQRAFVRQTINLGGEVEQVDDDINQFAGTHTTDRLVLTVGRLGVNDIFDTNKYANNPKVDFLNVSLINTGTFDFAADAWGSTYGAVAEWYQGHWAMRAGAFDLTGPAGGNSPSYGLDPTLHQFQMMAEIEERHELWGQPGKIKITGFLSHALAGQFSDAVALALATGQPADINAMRSNTSRPGVSLNLEQQVTDSLGIFARAGWADGKVQFSDTDLSVSGGVAIAGKSWGRPDDTIGVAGVLNGISGRHVAFLNAGGLGNMVGDGQLPNSGMEKILEAYYSYALTVSTRLTLDYQHVSNPAYNVDRGPVNAVAARMHWQF